MLSQGRAASGSELIYTGLPGAPAPPASLPSLPGLFPCRGVQAPDPGKAAHGLHTQAMAGGTPGRSMPMSECFLPGRGHYPGSSSPPMHWARSSQQPHFHVLLAPEEGELSLNAELEVFLGTRYNCSLQSMQTFSSSRTHHSKETLSLCPCHCPSKKSGCDLQR